MIRIGILGAADIAFNRFMPALTQAEGLTCVGVARYSESEDESRVQRFVERYHLPIFQNFTALIEDANVDAVYLPIPPATHYEWTKKVLEAGKHALVEKPITCHASETAALLRLAEIKNLALYENFMFAHHSQLQSVKRWINEEKIGELRHISAYFGFPLRATGDFRYNKDLGGGARLDAAGYLIKLAEILMDGPSVLASQINMLPGYSVDMFGSMMLVDRKGLSFQAAYGMDNAYRCELDLWGSKARLHTNRILTAPPDVKPSYTLIYQGGQEEICLPEDDHFLHSIEHFVALVDGRSSRVEEAADILRGSELLQALEERSLEDKGLGMEEKR